MAKNALKPRLKQQKIKAYMFIKAKGKIIK